MLRQLGRSLGDQEAQRWKEVILHGDSGGCLINWDGIHIIQVWKVFII